MFYGSGHVANLKPQDKMSRTNPDIFWSRELINRLLIQTCSTNSGLKLAKYQASTCSKFRILDQGVWCIQNASMDQSSMLTNQHLCVNLQQLTSLLDLYTVPSQRSEPIFQKHSLSLILSARSLQLTYCIETMLPRTPGNSQEQVYYIPQCELTGLVGGSCAAGGFGTIVVSTDQYELGQL